MKAKRTVYYELRGQVGYIFWHIGHLFCYSYCRGVVWAGDALKIIDFPGSNSAPARPASISKDRKAMPQSPPRWLLTPRNVRRIYGGNKVVGNRHACLHHSGHRDGIERKAAGAAAQWRSGFKEKEFNRRFVLVGTV